MMDYWFLNEWLSITEGIVSSDVAWRKEILSDHALHPPILWKTLPSLGLPEPLSVVLERLYELIEHPHPTHTLHHFEEATDDFLRVSRSFRRDLPIATGPIEGEIELKFEAMRVLWLGIADECEPLPHGLRRRIWSDLRQLRGFSPQSTFFPTRGERLQVHASTGKRWTATQTFCSCRSLPWGHGVNYAVLDSDAIARGYDSTAEVGPNLVERTEFGPRTGCDAMVQLWLSGPTDLDPLDWLVSAKRIAPWVFNVRTEFEFEDTQVQFGRWQPGASTEDNRDYLVYLAEEAYYALLRLRDLSPA